MFVGSYTYQGYWNAVAVDVDTPDTPHVAWILSEDTVYSINIFNPSNPTLIKDTVITGSGKDIMYYYYDERLYIAAGPAGLHIYDRYLFNKLGSFDTPGSALGVKAASRRLAYVADSSGGLRIINVANPANPVETGTCLEAQPAAKVWVLRPRAYVAALDSGLYVVDVADSSNPTVIDHTLVPGSAVDVSARGDTICVLTRERGIYFYLMTPVGLKELNPLPISFEFQIPTLVRNDRLTVRAVFPKAGHIEMTLYNLLGQKVRCLSDTYLMSGEHQFEISMDGIKAGIYFIVFRSDEFDKSYKIVVIK